MANLPFTGEDDGTDNPLQSILGGARNVGQGINDTLFRDPESRSALLQIGLNLMQPQAQGQTTMGQIGQALGSGGESVTRNEELDIKKQKADDALTIAELRMRAARDPNSLTEYQRQSLEQHQEALRNAAKSQRRGDIREQRMTLQEQNKRIREETARLTEIKNNLTTDEKDKDKVRLGAMDDAALRAEARKNVLSEDAAVNAAVPDDTEDGDGAAAKPSKIAKDSQGRRMGLFGSQWKPIK